MGLSSSTIQFVFSECGRLDYSNFESELMRMRVARDEQRSTYAKRFVLPPTEGKRSIGSAEVTLFRQLGCEIGMVPIEERRKAIDYIIDTPHGQVKSYILRKDPSFLSMINHRYINRAVLPPLHRTIETLVITWPLLLGTLLIYTVSEICRVNNKGTFMGLFVTTSRLQNLNYLKVALSGSLISAAVVFPAESAPGAAQYGIGLIGVLTLAVLLSLLFAYVLLPERVFKNRPKADRLLAASLITPFVLLFLFLKPR